MNEYDRVLYRVPLAPFLDANACRAHSLNDSVLREFLKCHVDERFTRQADAVEHVMEDEGGQDADDQRSGVTEERGGRGGKLIPKFAQNGGHGWRGWTRLFQVTELGG